ncbi:hypothetical protein HYW32_01645 [Candidatus Berkelbacteria bacterium]|nr:hypothetical protein [Candidatus Berkelbacteria bacterium]
MTLEQIISSFLLLMILIFAPPILRWVGREWPPDEEWGGAEDPGNGVFDLVQPRR